MNLTNTVRDLFKKIKELKCEVVDNYTIQSDLNLANADRIKATNERVEDIRLHVLLQD
jgi:hypothetical protein